LPLYIERKLSVLLIYVFLDEQKDDIEQGKRQAKEAKQIRKVTSCFE